MSKAFDLRTQIKAAIVAADIGLVAGDVVIERQHDFLNQLDQLVVATSNSVLCRIAPARGKNINPAAATLRWDTTLVVSLWTMTALTSGAQPEEDIHEGLMDALHHAVMTVHADSARASHQRLMVTDFFEVDDFEFLRRDTIVETEFVTPRT